jgi:cold shock CspA family protein
MSKIGIVKHWNEDRGFGHIGQEHDPQDIFVHRTCLMGAASLKVNDRVLYDAIYDDRKKKFQAVSCKIIGSPPENVVPHGMGHVGFPHAAPHPHHPQQMPAMVPSPNTMSPLQNGMVGQYVPHMPHGNSMSSQHFSQSTLMRQNTPPPGGMFQQSPGNGMHGAPSPGQMQQFW